MTQDAALAEAAWTEPAGVVLAGTSVDPYNGKAVRASAGSLFHLPLVVDPSVGTGGGMAACDADERVGTAVGARFEPWPDATPSSSRRS